MKLSSLIVDVSFFGYILVCIFLYVKGRAKIILHPILAIFTGFAVTFAIDFILFAFFAYFNVVNLVSALLTLAIAAFIGGFVATFLSRENKAIIGLWEGIIFGMILLITIFVYASTNIEFLNRNILLAFFVICLVFAGIGGFIAEKISTRCSVMGLFDDYKKKSLVKKAINFMTQEKYQSLTGFNNALEFANEALELDPNYALAWHIKGGALIGMAKPEEGLKCLDNAVL
ncbi:MAG: YrzE family protein [Methanobacterium paludis]|nr:YrzE family protein [Methanobacterium paludis]